MSPYLQLHLFQSSLFPWYSVIKYLPMSYLFTSIIHHLTKTGLSLFIHILRCDLISNIIIKQLPIGSSSLFSSIYFIIVCGYIKPNVLTLLCFVLQLFSDKLLQDSCPTHTVLTPSYALAKWEVQTENSVMIHECLKSPQENMIRGLDHDFAYRIINVKVDPLEKLSFLGIATHWKGSLHICMLPGWH